MNGLGSVFVAILLLAGCPKTHSTASQGHGSVQGSSWTETQALAILRAGIESSDSSTRAVAASSWIGSMHPSSSVLAGWVLADPSPHVQRVSAKTASKAGVSLTPHPTTDPLAALWMGWPERVTTGEHKSLALAIEGDEAGLVELLADLSEGTISPETDVLELLVRAELRGTGDALAKGSAMAEEPLRLPMALASVALNSAQGPQAVAGLLKEDTGEELRIEAVEETVRLGGPRSQEWLERAAKGSLESVAHHAKIGLVVSGQTSFEFVLGALTSPDRDTRAWAAQCLTIAAAERTLPRDLILALQASVRDEAPAVRWGAVEALLAAAGPGAVLWEPRYLDAEPDAVSMLIAGKWLEVAAQHTLEATVEGAGE